MRLLFVLKLILLPLGMVAIGVAAGMVALADAPDGSAAPEVHTSPAPYEQVSRVAAIRAAIADSEANELTSDNVYQQQVVNGWVARDLLEVLALQADDQAVAVSALNTNVESLLDAQQVVADAASETPPIDDRPRQLLALAVAALCWLGLWMAVPAVSARRSDGVNGPSSVEVAMSQPFIPPAVGAPASQPIPIPSTD